MKLTMKGFLLAECNRLAGMERHTTSLKKLFEAAMTRSGARAREYVFLLAVETSKLDAFARLVERFDVDASQREKEVLDAFRGLLSLARPFEGHAEAFLEARGEQLGKRYAQVLVAFHAPEAKMANDERVKGLMRDKTLLALQEAGKTAYQMVRDLGLNKGNAYAYLRGDLTKVSRGTARRMYDYATGA